MLIKRPEDVSISELLRLIDGPIAPLPCLSRRAYQRCEDCTDEASCRLRRVFSEVFWSYLILIESLSLADMLGTPDVAQALLQDGATCPSRFLAIGAASRIIIPSTHRNRRDSSFAKHEYPCRY